jgi:hypothetical protein
VAGGAARPPRPDHAALQSPIRSDPKEETDVKDFNPGVIAAVDNVVARFWATVDEYPLIPVGAPDPYTPPPGPTRR